MQLMYIYYLSHSRNQRQKNIKEYFEATVGESEFNNKNYAILKGVNESQAISGFLRTAVFSTPEG